MTMSVQVKDIPDGTQSMGKTPLAGTNVVLLVPKSRSPGMIRQGSMPPKAAVLRGSKLSCSSVCTNAILSNVVGVPNGPIPTTNNSSASSTSSGAELVTGESVGVGKGGGSSTWLTTSNRPLQSSLKKSSYLESSVGGNARSVHFDKRRPQTLELDLSTSPASSSASIAAVTGRSSTVSVHFNDTLSYSQSYDESDQANDPSFSLSQSEHMELGELISSDEEKKLKRASCVIGVIAALIFLLCFAMVAVTLHLSPEIDKLATEQLATVSVQRQFNSSVSTTTSTLDFDLDPGDNEETVYPNEKALDESIKGQQDSSNTSPKDESNLLKAIEAATSQKLRSLKTDQIEVSGISKAKFDLFRRQLKADDQFKSLSEKAILSVK